MDRQRARMIAMDLVRGEREAGVDGNAYLDEEQIEAIITLAEETT